MIVFCSRPNYQNKAGVLFHVTLPGGAEIMITYLDWLTEPLTMYSLLTDVSVLIARYQQVMPKYSHFIHPLTVQVNEI